MKSALVITVGLLMLLSGCTHDQERSFQDLTSAFIQWYFKSNPSIATETGYHEFDGLLEQTDRDFLKENLSDIKRFDLELSQIDRADLSNSLQVDYEILQHQIEAMIYSDEELYMWTRDPLQYQEMISRSIQSILQNPSIPMADKTSSLLLRFDNIPGFLLQAETNLENMSSIYRDAALYQLRENIRLLENTPLQVTSDDFTLDLLDEKIGRAITALQRHETWLAGFTPTLGRLLSTEEYSSLFRFRVNAEESASELVTLAQIELRRVQDRMFELSLPVYLDENDEPVWVNRQDTLQVIHWGLASIPGREWDSSYLMENLSSMLERLATTIQANLLFPVPDRRFEIYTSSLAPWESLPVRAHHFAELDTYQPAYLVLQGEYDGYSAADIPALPADDFALTLYAMREATPGRLTFQLLGNEESSVIRTVIPDMACREGWNLFSTEVLLNAGYGAGDYRFELSYLHQLAVLSAAVISEIRSATQTSSVESELSFLVEEAFVTPSASAQLLTSMELKPFVNPAALSGLLQLSDLMIRIEQAEEDHFSLPDACRRILAQGAVPIQLLQAQLLNN